MLPFHGEYMRSSVCTLYSVVGANAQRSASPTEENPAQFDVVIQQVHVNGGLRQTTA